jgi:hypothetical protein
LDHCGGGIEIAKLSGGRPATRIVEVGKVPAKSSRHKDTDDTSTEDEGTTYDRHEAMGLLRQKAVSATRTALAMSVKVRFLAGRNGRTEPSTTNRLGNLWLRHDGSTLIPIGRLDIGIVPE